MREEIFGGKLGGRKRGKGNLPVLLTGYWRSEEGTFSLSQSGEWTFIEGPHHYILSEEKDSFTWNGRTFHRWEGSAKNLIGKWRTREAIPSRPSVEGHVFEVVFNGDGTSLLTPVKRNEETDESYPGFYHASENLLSIHEHRATVSLINDHIYFAFGDDKVIQGTYSVSESELRIVFFGNETMVFYRSMPTPYLFISSP